MPRQHCNSMGAAPWFAALLAIVQAGGCGTPHTDPNCGDGVRGPTEACDPAVAAGQPGACPTSCDDGNRCTDDLLTGSADQCTAACLFPPNGACTDSCGDGTLQPYELCDPAIPTGAPGACPTSCDDQNACTVDTLTGNPMQCSASCAHKPIDRCVSGDGCCPATCQGAMDRDCPCGDGILQPDELCDPAIAAGAPGACPVSCDDAQACTLDVPTGNAATCDAACEHRAIQTCQPGDGCCGPGCSVATDPDCSAMCGDGVLQPPRETCDPMIAAGLGGACPMSCDDGIACTQDRLVGSAAQCNVVCERRAITYCQPGDGCCPSSCGFYEDSDCPPPAGGVGVPCAADGDCLLPGAAPGLRCLTQEQTGWPGGVCSLGCMTQGDCPQASRCVGLAEMKQRVCLPGCLADADCERPGHACLGGARHVCVPRADWPFGSPVGTRCMSSHDCTGDALGFCLTEAGHGFKTGYCSHRCDDGQPCPPHSHCLLDAPTGRQLCVKQCEFRSRCGAPVESGVDCYDADRDGVRECWKGFGRIGDPCARPLDCPGGECLTGMLWPAGYCTRACSVGMPGSCPDGGSCQLLGQRASCLAGCTMESECREDYRCDLILSFCTR